MAKYNGTVLFLIADGVMIAAQKGLTYGVSQNLFDTTNKESAGWEEHGNGMRKMDVGVDGLMSTTGLSAAGLLDYIFNRQSFLLVISGLTYPWVMEADLLSVSLTANQEEAAALSGSIKVKGTPHYLSGTKVNLITDPDGGTTDYDTLTVSGLAITSAINAAGSAYCMSNAINVTDEDVIKLFVFVTLTSGELPTVGIWDNTSAYISNQVALVEGFNLVTLTATGSDATASLRITNTAAANWATSNIYLFIS